MTHQVSYIGLNLLLYFIYSAKNPIFEQFKVHSEKWPWEEEEEGKKAEFKALLWRTLKTISINQLIVAPILLYINAILLKRMDFRRDLDSFPSLFEIIWQHLFSILCDDFAFYWGHRLLHWSSIYSYVHKQHHEYKITVGIASEYAHPIEFVFGNVLPTSLGSMILGSRMHAFTQAFWIFDKILRTTEAHSGYQFAWSPTTLLPFKNSAEFHNLHHLKFRGNYGGFCNFWDWACGTNTPGYLESVEKRR